MDADVTAHILSFMIESTNRLRGFRRTRAVSESVKALSAVERVSQTWRTACTYHWQRLHQTAFDLSGDKKSLISRLKVINAAKMCVNRGSDDDKSAFLEAMTLREWRVVPLQYDPWEGDEEGRVGSAVAREAGRELN